MLTPLSAPFIGQLRKIVYRFECPFMTPSNAVDWIGMRDAIGEAAWREYVAYSRELRAALRT
jgi:hypothetical protein